MDFPEINSSVIAIFISIHLPLQIPSKTPFSDLKICKSRCWIKVGQAITWSFPHGFPQNNSSCNWPIYIYIFTYWYFFPRSCTANNLVPREQSSPRRTDWYTRNSSVRGKQSSAPGPTHSMGNRAVHSAQTHVQGTECCGEQISTEEHMNKYNIKTTICVHGGRPWAHPSRSAPDCPCLLARHELTHGAWFAYLTQARELAPWVMSLYPVMLCHGICVMVCLPLNS